MKSAEKEQITHEHGKVVSGTTRRGMLFQCPAYENDNETEFSKYSRSPWEE